MKINADITITNEAAGRKPIPLPRHFFSAGKLFLMLCTISALFAHFYLFSIVADLTDQNDRLRKQTEQLEIIDSLLKRQNCELPAEESEPGITEL